MTGRPSLRAGTWRAAFVALAVPAVLPAQADSLPAFNALRTPTSPAFVLLGVEPTSVERPNTPSQLALTVLTKTDRLASLPRDFALEVSPFWLFHHPTLTWEQDSTRSIPASLARTATFSVATAQRGTSSSPETGVSLGIRAAILSGSMTTATRATLRRLEQALGAPTKIAAFIIAELSRDANAQLLRERADARGDSAKEAAAGRRHEERMAVVQDLALKDPRVRAILVDSIAVEYQAFAAQRVGFLLEVAGGAVWSAPGAVFDSVRFQGWGAWVTASYESPVWSIVGLGRFLAADTTGAFDTFDFGVRLLHTRRRYALSAEYVDRYFLGSGAPAHQYRLAGVWSYQLQKGTWVNATFGKGFDARSSGSLLAQLSLSFDFADERYRNPK